MRPPLAIPSCRIGSATAQIATDRPPARKTDARKRAGLTLLELVLAVAILTMSVVALGAMARAVQISNEYGEGYGTATQVARVALSRITQAVNDAYGVDSLPGAWALETTGTTGAYPDTLVIWRPDGAPVNPAGPPLARELVIFCPDPNDPNEFLEIKVPSDNTPVPSPTSIPAFQAFVNGLKASGSAQKVVLTDLLRTANGRGAVRFVVTLNPSAAQWTSFRNATASFSSLPWPQSILGPNAGLRQVWVRTELQMVPFGQWLVTNPSAQEVVPYFGSATFSYVLKP